MINTSYTRYDMNYVSTRDENTQTYTFSEVLLSGLAQDGGLFIPEIYPFIDHETLKKYKSLSYAEIAYTIIEKFVGESIPKKDLEEILNKTYTETKFKDSKITPIKKLYNNIYLQDLSLGPSLAFKDLAMQFLGNIIEYELTKQNKVLTILGASSGDTVSAAEEAMRSKERINVVMLTPKEGMSEFQKAQAGTILDKNIFNISVDGTFDICQDIVKEVNKDIEFKQKYSIGAVNSINWGRICAQIVYYFYGYLNTVDTVGEPLDIIVPSGNFGNMLAGYIAKQMGLPIRKLIIATNENKVLDILFKTGVYKQETVVTTSSPSMDISKASNFERLLYDCLKRNAKQCSKLMKEFESKKEINLSDLITTLKEEHEFSSDSSTHEDRIKTIKTIYKDTKIIIDPHTAAAIHVAIKNKESDIPMLCMETAKPTKFEMTIQESIGTIPKREKGFENIESKKQKFYNVDSNASAIKDFIRNNIKL